MKRSGQDLVGSDDSQNQRARIENGDGRHEVRRVENPPGGPVNMPAGLSSQMWGRQYCCVRRELQQHLVQRRSSRWNPAPVGSAAIPPLPWAGGEDARIPAHLMPHRKPKNFADRLMRVLLNGSAPDTLWWVGDGKAVAVQARNLKRGNLLDSYFKIKDYNAFIRNCNRWGFSKTNQYVVPDGVKVYQCSLFQRDAPHLMLHMRIDSDVQDVFMRHVDLEDQEKKKPANSEGPTGGATASASTPMVPSQYLNGGGNGVPGNLQTLMLQMAQAQSNTNQGSQVPPQGFPQQSTSFPPAAQSGTQAATGQGAPQDNSALLQTLMLLVNNGTATQPPAPAPSNEVTTDGLLTQIMSVSDQYLKHVANESPNEMNQPIQTLMQLLQIHIRKYREHRAEQERQQQQQQALGGASVNAVEPLLRELLKAQFQGNSAPSLPGMQQQQAVGTPMNQQVQPTQGALYSPQGYNSSAGPQQVPQTAATGGNQQQGPSRQANSNNVAAPPQANAGGQDSSLQQNTQNALGQFLMQFMQQNGQGGNVAPS